MNLLDDSLSRGEIEDILVECSRSTETMARVFFPQFFWRPFSPQIHERIFDLFDNSDNPLKCIAAPRGIGKTSLIYLPKLGRDMLFRDAHFIIPVSKSIKQSMSECENLKRELFSNELILKLFGIRKTDSFSKEDWIVGFPNEPDSEGVRVMPLGRGGQIRGMKFGKYRPKKVLLDDLEDKELVRSEERVMELKEWVNSDVLNCVDKADPDREIIFIGTVLSENSVLEDLLKDNSGWDSVRLSICDPQSFKSFWPDFMPDWQILEELAYHRQNQTLDQFCLDYLNIPQMQEGRAFQESMFRYYDEGTTDLRTTSQIRNVILIDPAREVTVGTANTAILVLAIDFKDNLVYVRDAYNAKMMPGQIVHLAFDLVQRYGAVTLGVDKVGLGEFIMHPLHNENMKRRTAVDIVELKSSGTAKEDRVHSLTYFYRRGQILHNPMISGPLEMQLIGFPKTKYWDLMDCLAYVIQLMEKRSYFFPGTVGYETQESVEEEYARLEARLIPMESLQWVQS